MKILPKTSLTLLVAALHAAAPAIAAQDGAAGADGGMNQPMELPPAEQAPVPVPPAAADSRRLGPAAGRKPDSGEELVGLQFRNQDIKALIDIISLWTGKVVIPKETALAGQKITIVSDRKMPKSEALNLIFQAFRLNDLGVVETGDLILIDSITDLTRLQPTTVLGPEIDIADLPENGNIVVKVFRIKNTKAAQIWDRLQDSLPGYAQVQLDNNSNQIIFEGDVALGKRVNRLIEFLDVQA